MKKLFFLLLSLAATAASAQSLKPSVIASGGGNYSGASLQVSWTLGETFTQTLTSGNAMLTQGFQQPACVSPVNPVISGNAAICTGQSTSFTASATGTNENSSYSWTGPDNFSANTSTIDNLTKAGAYTCTISNGTGCTVNVSKTLSISPLPSVSAGQDQIHTINNGNVSLSGTPAGGNWAGTGVSLGGSFNTQQPVGTYSLVYCFTSAQNCRSCDTMTVTLLNPPTKVATPVITPTTGTYSGPQTVTISCLTPSAKIYYTTNGNNPLLNPFPNSFTRLYSGPFQVFQNTTVRAIGVVNGAANSNIAASFISLTNPTVVANPIISPNGGSHNGSVTVTLSTTPNDAQIYFTTNGNVPSLASPNSFTRLYTGPFTLTSSATVRAMGVKAGLTNSGVSVANFSVISAGTVAPVVFSPAPGAYAGAQSVSMSSATENAVIYFTTNGNAPLLNPFPNSFTRIFSSPLSISASATVRAVATKQGMNSSPVAVGIYTITPLRMATDQDENLNYFFEDNNQEISEIQSFEVFPNPVSDRLHIRIHVDSELEAKAELYDAKGSRVIQKSGILTQGGTFELETGNLPSGIYQLVLKSGQQIWKTKVLK